MMHLLIRLSALLVLFTFSTSLLGTEALPIGSVYVQHRQQFPASPVALDAATVRVRSPYSNSELELPLSSLQGWLSAGKGLSLDPVFLDRVQLINGQWLQGQILNIEADSLLLRMSWGQKLPIPLASVASVSLSSAVQDSDRVSPPLVFPSSRELLIDSGAIWKPAGKAWFSRAAGGQPISRSYEGDFSSFRIEIHLHYLNAAQARNLEFMVNSERARIFLNLDRKGRLRLRANSLIPEGILLTPDLSAQGPVSLKITLELDAENRRFSVKVNDRDTGSATVLADLTRELLRNPKLELKVDPFTPVLVEQFSLQSFKPTTIPAASVSSFPAIRLANGELIEAELLSLDESDLRIRFSGQELTLPRAGLSSLELKPLAAKPAPATWVLGLLREQPLLYAQNLELDESGMLTANLAGLGVPLNIPLNQLSALLRPLDNTPLPSGNWVLEDAEGLRVDGDLLSLSESSIRIQPFWSSTPLELPRTENQWLMFPERKRSLEMNSVVILSTGERLLGKLGRDEDGNLMVQDERYGQLRLDPRFLRSVYQVNGRSRGSWIVDPFQLAFHAGWNGGLARVEPELQADRSLKFKSSTPLRFRLPKQSRTSYTRVVYDPLPNGPLTLQYDFRNQEKGNVGLSMTLSQDRLYYISKQDYQNVPLVEQGEGPRSMEVFLDKELKQLRVLVNGELVLDQVLDARFPEEESDFVLRGIVDPALRLRELQVLPAPPPKDAPFLLVTPEAVQALPQPEGDLGNLVEELSGSRAESVTASGGASMFIRRVPFPLPPENDAEVEVYLQDHSSRLRGEALELKDGKLRLDHPAFPEGVQLPLAEVKLIHWEEEPPYRKSSFWNRF